MAISAHVMMRMSSTCRCTRHARALAVEARSGCRRRSGPALPLCWSSREGGGGCESALECLRDSGTPEAKRQTDQQ
eukprot:5012792-Pleurochrysis_carterae.AAC.2